LLVTVYLIHLGNAHKTLKRHGVQPHQHSAGVERIVPSGPYSKVRHPGYVGLVLIYFGFTLGFGVVWMLVAVVIFSALTCLTVVKEEELLEERFGKEYEEYMRQVPWRLIPKVI